MCVSLAVSWFLACFSANSTTNITIILLPLLLLILLILLFETCSTFSSSHYQTLRLTQRCSILVGSVCTVRTTMYSIICLGATSATVTKLLTHDFIGNIPGNTSGELLSPPSVSYYPGWVCCGRASLKGLSTVTFSSLFSLRFLSSYYLQ